jgi:hypothetical protein
VCAQWRASAKRLASRMINHMHKADSRTDLAFGSRFPLGRRELEAQRATIDAAAAAAKFASAQLSHDRGR